VRPFTISLITSALLAVAACGGDGGDAADGPARPEDGASAPTSGQYFEHLEGRLPADFPNDFPVYADVTIHRGDTIDDRYAIDLRSEAGLDDVAAFYREELAVAPWSITAEESAHNSVVFTYENTDGRPYHGQVAIGKLQDRTWILVAMVFKR
jgi:hypothetical protein